MVAVVMAGLLSQFRGVVLQSFLDEDSVRVNPEKRRIFKIGRRWDRSQWRARGDPHRRP
jgi:hypothetical protein